MRYKAYYAKNFRDFCFGDKLPDPKNLAATHQLVRVFEAKDTDDAFYKCQGEVWSPNGETRELIEALGLQHTSMSVGDVLGTEDGKLLFVARHGFTHL